jgi:hypothetical protein
MRKWFVVGLLWGLILFPFSADAQGSTQLEAVNIELWSEYDQPSMLVIHEFVVDKSTALPTQVNLRFPKDANLIAIAFENGGHLFNAEFEGPKEHGNWQIVTLNVKSHDPHRIEYYQPLTLDGNKRKFSFQWFGDYPVKQFSLSALIPTDSTNIITSPNLSNTSKTSNGLYLTSSKNLNLGMGEAYSFQIEYNRQSESVNPMRTNVVEAADPIGAETTGRVSVDKLPWIIGGFGVASVAVILFLFSYWRSMQTTTKLSGFSASSHENHDENRNSQLYCHECGTRAQPGDRFCRMCGTKLRIE